MNNSFKSMLKASMALVGLAPSGKKQIEERVAPPPRKAHGHIIRKERLGPYLKQIGWTAEGKRIMYKHFIHRELHATKGWRTRSYSMGTSVK